MSYHIYLFRKEVKEQNDDFNFLDNSELILKFTNEQFKKLEARLLKYGFQIESRQDHSIRFNFNGGQPGISALLTKSQLSFSSGFSQEGIFEISMTASEFTDTGEFVKLNPQEGTWESI